MKLPSALYCLKTITNSPLPILSNEDVEQTLQNDSSNRPLTGTDVSDVINWTKITTPPTFTSKLHSFKTPPCIDSLRKFQSFRTPCLSALLNLGLSQPVTPITPSLWKNVDVTAFATPYLSQRNLIPVNDNFIIPTPMIINSLKSLSRPTGYSGPDILQLIDDDSKTIESINIKMIGYTDIELDDNNVVDYVMNITEDILYTDTIKIQEEIPAVIQVKRRKGRHSKRMTEEESRSYRDRRKQLEKERKKERLNKLSREEVGITRRSIRSKNKKVKYR